MHASYRAAAVLGLGLGMIACTQPGAPTADPSMLALPSPEPSPPEVAGPLDPGAAAAVAFAEAQVGKRYCWGGSGPSCFDCSGLVQAAWRASGLHLPRTSDAQGRALVEVPFSELRPGDILWWRGHVGLYIGGGAMIDAYHSGAGVVRRRAAIPQRVLRVGDRQRGQVAANLR